MAPEKAKGFTLLELIVSLTVLGVIVTIVFGALRIGVRAWEKGESGIEEQQRCRIVLDRLQQQMASMVFPVDVTETEAAKYLLKGDASSLEFISRISLMPENRSGPVYVKYEVRKNDDGGRSLSCYEQNLARRSADPLENDVEADDFHVLIPSAAECGFAYFKASNPEAGGEKKGMTGEKTAVEKDAGVNERQVFSWETSWDPEVERHNPRAVALRLRTGGDAAPVRVVVPLPGEDRL